MGKFTKMALVVLYLLQLVVVFREQLAHLYKTAVDSVASGETRRVSSGETRSVSSGETRGVSSGETRGVSSETQNVISTRQGASRAVFEKTVKISSPGTHETLAAVSILSISSFIISDNNEQGEDLHNEDDKHADRVRKHRQRGIREYLIGNLWGAIKNICTMTERDELANAAVRILTFA